MPVKRNWLLIGGLLILTSGIIGVGIYMMKRPSRVVEEPPEEEISEKPVSLPVEEPEEVGLTPEIDTSDWKTYRNEEYGFELKYPVDWEFQYYSPAIYFFPKIYGEGIYTPISLKLQVKSIEGSYQPKAQLEEYYIKERKFYRDSLFPREVTYILPREDNSKIAEAVLSIKTGVATHTQYIENRNDYLLSDEEIKNLSEQMLATFKFIKEIKKERKDIKVKKEIQLTQNSQDEEYPSFSPDGEKIVFWREGNIWMMNSDGSSPERLTNFEETGGLILFQEKAPTLSFSSDGQKIIFSKEGQIWIIDKDGSNLKQLTKDKRLFKYSPSFSPDDRKIVYSAGRTPQAIDEPLGIHVWIMDSDGSNPKRLTSSEDNIHPFFSPDGKKIIYSSCVAGTKDIWIMNIDGTGKIQLTDRETEEYFPSFSPDMEKIVFTQGIIISSRIEYLDLWMMDSDGNNKIRLTEDEAFDLSPSFSPDGKKIIFSSDRAGNYDIWMMELEY